MDQAMRWLRIAITLGLVGAICYGVYAAVSAMFSGLSTLNENVAATVIAACATVIVSVVTVVYNQRQNKAREIAESHRPQKIEVYQRFMEKAVVGLLRASKQHQTNTPKFQKELQNLFMKFTGDVIVWGSPGVLRAYSDFRACDEGEHRILLELDNMLREIRTDLGNSNWGLDPGDLIALFLTDPESLAQVIAENSVT